MTEKRVMHLITRLVSGGAESMTEDAIQALKESEYDCEIFLGYGNEYDVDLVNKFDEKGINTVSFSYMRHYNPIALLLSIISLSIFLNRNKIDVIHTHSTEAGIVGRIAGQITGTSTIIHSVHGVYFEGNNRLILNKMVELLERICASWTDELVADSESTRDAFLEQGVGTEDQFSIIPPVIPVKEFASAEPLDRDDGPFTFVFVGRLEENKGVLDLLEAFSKMTTEISVELLVVGDGELENKIKKRLNKLDTGTEIELLGYREDIPKIMASGDALVLPTYREGFSITVTEALAAGLPVISTPVGEIPKKIVDGQNGYIVEPGNIEKLTERMDQTSRRAIKTDSDYNSLQKYTKPEIFSQYIRLYKKYM